MLKIRDKVMIQGDHFVDKLPRKGVISHIIKHQRLDTGLFTLGLLHFHQTAILKEQTIYTVAYEAPAFGDNVRLVFREYDESELTKGWK